MDTNCSQVAPPIPLAEETPVRRSFVERLLDPRSIQWLLGSGGVLLVAGLVIWLASLGVFDNPWIVAGCMGVATLAVMGGGWTLLQRTRFTLAGRAITLLACLVMPLNLWFYHANDLITIEGHLWVAALACCVLYALSSLILADALFVYVLVAGVASTGLLILADMHRLAEIASPSVLLMVLALISLHVERAFSADQTKPFSRGRFGKACFISAQFLLAGSLGLLAGAQLIGHAHLPNLVSEVPAVVSDRSLQILAIVVTMLGAYACAYSGLVVRASARYLYAAVGLVLWAELQAIHTLDLTQTPYALVLMLAATGALGQLLAHALRRQAIPGMEASMRPMAMALSLLPILYAGYLFLNHGSYTAGNLDLLRVAGSILVAAAACRWGAYMARTNAAQSRICIAGSAIGVLIAGSMTLGYFGLTDTIHQAPWLMLAPVAYMTAAAIRRKEPVSLTLRLIANALAVVIVVATLWAAVWSEETSLMPLAQTFAVATLVYLLATISNPKGAYAYVATVCASLATVLVLIDLEASNLMVVGLVSALALLQVIAGGLLSGILGERAARSLKQAGFVLVSLLSFGQLLYSLSRMADGMLQTQTALSLGMVAIVAALAGTMARDGWKRWLLTLGVGQGLVAMGMLAHLSELSPARKLEIFSVAVGTLLLAIGHVAWQREQRGSAKSELASIGLTLGSILTAIPLLIAVIATRCSTGLSLPDELALLTAGTILFVAGLVLEIRSTTLLGGVALGIHLVILMISAGMRAQLAVGVYLAVGGGLLFALGVLLSIYRDRLLQIPSDVKQRKGVFRVLSWR